jgi:hypothetical protein
MTSAARRQARSAADLLSGRLAAREERGRSILLDVDTVWNYSIWQEAS